MLYAAYGSNLHPLRLSQRLPKSRFAGTAEITGRKLCFHKISKDKTDKSAKCNIVTGDGNIHVAIYELDERDKAILDRIEGVGFGYAIEAIEIPGFGEGFTYVAMASHIDDALRPYSWYKELVLVGCNVLGLPIDYIAGIREIAATDDRDHARHARNMGIVEQAKREKQRWLKK